MMNNERIVTRAELVIAAGTTILCSPAVEATTSPLDQNCSKMQFWSINHDYTAEEYGYIGSAMCIDEPTFIVIVGPVCNPALLWTMNDETWYYVLVNGELRLFRLCLNDIKHRHVKIIDGKIS